jgi:membrane protein YqaA with SNARE-associated domain
MLRRTYDKLMQLAASRQAPAWLAGVAFIEGVFFPIPPDVMLMPMVLAKRERAWQGALIVLVASVAGGSTGYAIGYFLHPVGEAIIRLTGGDIAHFKQWYGKWGLLLLATPLPYKITAIASGLFEFPYWKFLAASVVIRGARFFAVAGLIRAYGAPIQGFIEKRLALVVSAVALVVALALLALKAIH